MPMISSILTVLLLFALPAFADTAILQLRSGALAVGRVVGVDQAGVTLETESGEAKYSWSSLTPLTEYEVRADHIDTEDASAHVELAELCLRNALYPYARNEIATALGLGYEDKKRLEALRETVDQAEADTAFAEIETKKAEDDWKGALVAIREYIKGAPQNEHTARARAMIPDLIRRIDAQAVREAEEAAQADKDEQNSALAKRINRYLMEAQKAREAATKALTEGIAHHEKGAVSKARDGYTTAEKNLFAAYKAYQKVQRAVRRGIAHEKADKEKQVVRNKLVEVYLGLTRLYVDDRNYKKGNEYVTRALHIDPVNKEALAYRKKIDENWIRRSARGLTNTPGVRVTGGTSR